MALPKSLCDREQSKFVTSAAGNAAISTSNEALSLNKITEVVSGSLTFEGSTTGAIDRTDLAQWKIKKITSAGIETLCDFKSNGSFDQVWDNRAALFPYQDNFSLLFDGVNECLRLPSVPNLEFIETSVFSLSVWFKFTSLTNSKVLFYKGPSGANSNNSVKFFIPTNGRASFLLRASSNTDRVRVRIQNLSGTINDGNWHHLAATWDGSVSQAAANALIYFDGVLGTMNIQNDLLTGTIVTGNPWSISGVQSLTSDFWDGNLNEASFWNKALSLVEVQEIYNAGKPADLKSHSAIANLITWFPMNKETQFPNTNDEISSNDAVMTNMEAADYVADTP